MDAKYTFREISGLTKVTTVFLGLLVMLAVISIGSSFLQLELLNRGDYTQEEGEANDSREQIIGLLHMALNLITIVLFGIWIVRANKNARALGAYDLPITPGWAVGYFFVPILNLWRPYQAMRDLSRASRHPESWTSAPTGLILPVWWTLWILENVAGQIAFRMSLHVNGLEELKEVTCLQILAGVLEVPLCFVALALISQIAHAQNQQQEQQINQIRSGI